MSARSRLPYVAVGLAAALAVQSPGAARSAPMPPDETGDITLARALTATQKSGRPTIVIATSGANPDSQAVGREFLGICKARGVEKSAQVVELSAEACPEAVRRFKLTTYPAILAFRQGAEGPELAGREDPTKDAFDALGYVSALDLEPASPEGARSDPSVVRSNHHLCDPLPSAQGYAPPAPEASVPAPVPVYAPVAAPQQYAVPMMAAPANPYVGSPSPSPVVVSAPSPSIVFQQSAPTIYMAPPQAPTVVVGTAPPSMPNVSFAPTIAASPPQQPQQMFLMAAPAPMFAPMVAATAPAPAAVAAYPVAVAASPAPAAVPAPAPPTVQLAAAPSTLAVTAIRPGPLGRLVGNFGERLMKHKYPRVAGLATTTTTTVLAQPITTVAAPGPIQVQTIAAPAPAPAPQQVATPYLTAAPPAVAQPQPQYQPPPALATPQQTGPSSFGLFKHR